MNSTANQAISGAIATAKQNSSKIKSVKIKIKFDSKGDGIKKYANKTHMGARAMNWRGPNG